MKKPSRGLVRWMLLMLLVPAFWFCLPAARRLVEVPALAAPLTFVVNTNDDSDDGVCNAAHCTQDNELRRLINILPGVSLADGQTLPVTLVNVGSNPFEIDPCVFDSDGAHLKTGATVRLAPGHMSSFEMSRAEAGRRTESRVEVRAGVHINDEDLKSLMVSGEVIEDATGKSSLFLPGETPPDPIHAAEETPPDPIRPEETPPDPILPAVGITYGQTLHATFLNVGRNPLEIVPCVFNDEGEHIKTGDRMMLQPGQMLSLDMSRSEVSGRTENRLQVRVAVHAAINDLKYLRSSGEVIEDATSRATLFMPGLVSSFETIKQ